MIVQLDLLSHLRKTPASPTLKAVKLLKRRSRFHNVITDLSHQSRRAPPRDWVASKVLCPRRLWFCQHVSVLEISAPLWAFPPDIALHVSTGQSRIHEARSFSGASVSLFQQDPMCLGPSMKVSYKQMCILLRRFYSESDFVFRLVPVCLVVCLLL